VDGSGVVQGGQGKKRRSAVSPCPRGDGRCAQASPDVVLPLSMRGAPPFPPLPGSPRRWEADRAGGPRSLLRAVDSAGPQGGANETDFRGHGGGSVNNNGISIGQKRRKGNCFIMNLFIKEPRSTPGARSCRLTAQVAGLEPARKGRFSQRPSASGGRTSPDRWNGAHACQNQAHPFQRPAIHSDGEEKACGD
jgi:hypothetical protein